MGPNVGSMHGLPVLQPVALGSTIPLQFHDRRQAPITVIRKAARDGGADPAVKRRRAVVQRRQKRRERGPVRKLSHRVPTTLYSLFTSLTLPVLMPHIVPVVCSHISPVFRSLTVPSPLST